MQTAKAEDMATRKKRERRDMEIVYSRQLERCDSRIDREWGLRVFYYRGHRGFTEGHGEFGEDSKMGIGEKE
jgi:hypothetical protein